MQEPLELDCVTTALLLPREGPRTHRLPFASNGGFGLGSARGEENSSVLGVGCSVQNDGQGAAGPCGRCLLVQCIRSWRDLACDLWASVAFP